jgi:hypothetical protein
MPAIAVRRRATLAHHDPRLETTMKYQLLIYRDPNRQPPPTEHQAYIDYTQELAQAGILLSGEALEGVDTATSVSVRDGQTITVDGPFAETKEVLAGFYVIEVGHLDDAIKWAAKIPTATDGTIEVRPVRPMPEP